MADMRSGVLQVIPATTGKIKNGSPILAGLSYFLPLGIEAQKAHKKKKGNNPFPFIIQEDVGAKP